ncbi:MAG: hypothetical protein HYW26_05575 [Candidatus Aenigmarchaeota archaeon]|nr:hypothetical protein [Candidatus Aenigmarchaeota archaeon]
MVYGNPTRRELIHLALASAAAFYFSGCRPAERISYKKPQNMMTGRLFDEVYTFDAPSAWGVARELYPLTLQQAVDQRIIRLETDGDFALPLGVSRHGEKIDFERAMRAMWDEKLRRREFSRPGYQRQKELLQRFREKAVAETRKGARYSLKQYKQNEAAKAIELLKELHEDRRRTYGDNARPFMDAVVNSTNPDVIIGYNITEMLPRVAFRNGRREWINAALKAWYLDRLLKEAGIQFLTFYPARADPFVSISPFQMTKYAMEDVAAMNQFLPEAKRVPESALNLKSLQDHANSAMLFSYANWRRMVFDLGRYGLIDDARKAIESLDEREREIFVAAMTAATHNLPASRGAVIRHLRKPRRKFHLGTLEYLDSARKVYARSSVEASLIMPWYEKAEARHGRK